MAEYTFAQIKAPKDSAGSKPAGKSSGGSSSRFDAKKHPRGKAGSGKGGQFVALSYDRGSNTGTGYGSKQGDSRVKQVQQALRRLGIKDKNGKPLVVDGKYGPLTTSAVMAWQKRNGVKPADGKITPALLAKLSGGKKARKPGVIHKRSNLAKPTKPLAPGAKKPNNYRPNGTGTR